MTLRRQKARDARDTEGKKNSECNNFVFFFLFNCIINCFADLEKETWFLGQIKGWAASTHAETGFRRPSASPPSVFEFAFCV